MIALILKNISCHDFENSLAKAGYGKGNLSSSQQASILHELVIPDVLLEKNTAPHSAVRIDFPHSSWPRQSPRPGWAPSFGFLHISSPQSFPAAPLLSSSSVQHLLFIHLFHWYFLCQEEKLIVCQARYWIGNWGAGVQWKVKIDSPLCPPRASNPMEERNIRQEIPQINEQSCVRWCPEERYTVI